MKHIPKRREVPLESGLRFKVIVPFFNGLKYLKKCLESIASQTYSNYDVVVVDDASSEFGIKRYALDMCKQHG